MEVLEYLTKNNHDDLENLSTTSMDQEADKDDFFHVLQNQKVELMKDNQLNQWSEDLTI